MAVSDLTAASLKRAARLSYERGRFEGALARGALAALAATPAFALCNQTPAAALCLAGFAVVVITGRFLGGSYEDGARAGALAGILPCLLPALLRGIDPDLCRMLSSQGPWICGLGGVAAGIVLALRRRPASGWPFWSSALAALAFASALGCLPAGAWGFLGLAAGVIAGGLPVVVSRKRFA